MLVANGHHWDPRWPEPAFPGAEEFEGEQIHAHHYREPDVLRGKRVLVLGIGNSATDIAVESSRIAEKTFLAMRRGAYVHAQVHQRQADRRGRSNAADRRDCRSPVQRFFAHAGAGHRRRRHDHLRPAQARPQAASRRTRPSPRSCCRGSATATSRSSRTSTASPAAARVRFVDGSEEEIDLVVYCTGYKITFPFFDPKVFSAPDNRLPLYRRVVSVERPGLYFIGFIQPLGPIMPLAEAQCGMGRRPARRPRRRCRRRGR